MDTPASRLPGLDRSLFHPGQRVCCALSGGADSTALVLALQEANAEKEGLGVVLGAIHIHHGLRGAEADTDEAFVRALCDRLAVPLTVTRVDTPARQQATGEGLEEAARALRYAALSDLLATGAWDAVATAHTLDDQAETVLMKLLRGTWTEGLAGIAPVLRPSHPNPGSDPTSPFPTSYPSRAALPASGLILRPLLGTPRSAVEAFLAARQQPFQTDSSNADLSLTRNRLRHQLLPVLQSFNPAIVETLARTAALARDDEAFWQAETTRLLPGLLLPGKPVRGGGRAVSTAPGNLSTALELERLKSQPPALRGRLLRAAAAGLGCRLDAADTAKLLALSGLPAPGAATPVGLRAGARLELRGGLRAERSLRELRLSRQDPSTIPKKM